MSVRGLWLLLALLALLAGLSALPFALDTVTGRALLVQQMVGLRLESGLSLRVQRIDGSLWRRATLIGVAVHDHRGRFASIDRLVLDWRPLDVLQNRITVQEFTAGTVRISRWPDLLPTADPRLLPEQDIAIGSVSIGRLLLAEGLAGKARAITARGRANIAAGRALIDVQARTLPGSGGDTLNVQLDAEPERNRFKLAATLLAPAGGIFTTLAALPGPLTVTANGNGSWQRWDGRIAATLGAAAGTLGEAAGTPDKAAVTLADVAIAGRDGQFRANGRIDPARLLAGDAAALLAGGLAINAQVAAAGTDVQANLSVAGQAISGEARGQFDRSSERLTTATAKLTLADSAALASDLGVRGLTATARLAGPLLAPIVDTRLSLRTLAVGGADGAVLEGVMLAGIANLADRPLIVPVQASAARITGLPATVAAFAGAWRGTGQLRWQGGQLRAEDLRLNSGPLRLTGNAAYRPGGASGRGSGGASTWATNLVGDARGWLLPLPEPANSDLKFTASLSSGPGGRGTVGSGGFGLAIATLTGSITRAAGSKADLAGRFALAPGLAVTLSNLALSTPKLAAAGNGSWRSGGIISLAAAGKSSDWGPFSLAAAGTLAAPQLDAQLPRPGYGLSALAVQLDGSGAGWQITAAAESALGPVTLAAGLATDPAVRLAVERLAVAGFAARGEVAQTAAGPFAGTLTVAGQGLTGSAVLASTAGVQTAQLALNGRNLKLVAATPISIERLALNGDLALMAAGTSLTGKLDLAGLERGNLVLERAAGTIKLVDGSGSGRIELAGTSGEAFKLAFAADIAPGRYTLTGGGDYASRSARLSGPAVITNDAAGWHLAPVTVSSALGNAELAGDWGDNKRIDAKLDKLSLQMLGLAYPSLNLAGRLSGVLALRQISGAAPTGTAALRLNGLSRSTVAATSTPIDVGLNAALGRDGTVVRAVIVRAAKVEGRAQARLGPIPRSTADTAGNASTGLLDRLFAASVTGQLRYAGPAQDLWGLSGLTALDVRGALQLSADVSGTLGNPVVAGRLTGRQARVEAPLLGAVASNASLDARFTASSLELTRFSGSSGTGSITGSGKIDLSYERGFPIDIRMAVKDAAILGRDDVTATGSGTIRVATDEYGGVVSGQIKLTRAEYRIGRTAVADVPVLAVTEINTRQLGRRTVQYIAPTRWLFNLNVTADRSLKVTGMGINSEWQADVRVRGGATAPELFGRVQLVRGDYDFAGKRFQLTRGDIRFLGGNPPDPLITIAAENSGNGFSALLNIDGTAQRPQIKFSSVPVLPEDEVLSRVLFGASVTDLSAPEAIQLAGALTSLRGNGFNPIGAVSRGLGIDRLRILPADLAMGRR
ncbi:translocation/assembly module TamB domain-containing protein, partial [Sandarakinorhabdus sp.]|uniref:translocation/assembly module TamB domain-containing protein n=1 Tax=Sandarakinorhabdus sp. TaxID=1916663 RepID=UPI0033411E17